MRHVYLASALVLATPVLAQTPMVTEPEATGSVPGVVHPGGPGLANSGPASTGEFAPFGSAADRLTNNPAGDGNAEQTARAIPNLGRGGGGGSNGN